MTYSLSLNRKNSPSENQNKSREEAPQLNLPHHHHHHHHHHPPPPPAPPAPHRRFSLSTPEELRSSLLPPSFPQLSSSLSDEEYIASDHLHHHNQYDDILRSNTSVREGSSVSSSPSISTSPSSSATTIRSNRVARLVRQQELSRTRRFFLDNKLVFPSGKSTSDSPHPRSYLEEWIQEDAKIPSSNGLSSTNTATAATTTNIIHHAPEDIVRSSRQRLLVVANRLPVSATKSGPDWSLEVSAGGLVSALLVE